MARRLSFKIELSGPCSQSWENMAGGQRQRYCSNCDRHVHNLAALSHHEIENILLSTGGHLCGRIRLREDGSLLLPEPVNKKPHLAGVALFTIFAVVPGAGLAQKSGAIAGLQQSGRGADSEQGTTRASEETSENVSVHGTVTDPSGALVVGAQVEIWSKGSVIALGKTDAGGQFAVKAPAGDYQLSIAAESFVPFSKPLSVNAQFGAAADAALKLHTVTNITVVAELSNNGSTMGTMTATLDYGPWYRRLEFHLRHPLFTIKHIFHGY
jgi:hypothetical protein